MSRLDRIPSYYAGKCEMLERICGEDLWIRFNHGRYMKVWRIGYPYVYCSVIDGNGYDYSDLFNTLYGSLDELIEDLERDYRKIKIDVINIDTPVEIVSTEDIAEMAIAGKL